MCLTSLFKHSDTGTILARLCTKLCSHSANVSSVSQLADVAKLLAGKVDALGFGNLLAKEVTRVHSAYEALGHTSVPAKLLERLSIEFVTDMLDKISHGLLSRTQDLLNIRQPRNGPCGWIGPGSVSP